MLFLRVVGLSARRIICALACAILAVAALAAQDWKTARLDDGKISVRYRISERNSESGDKVPLIEDISTTIAEVNLSSCVSLMKDLPKHKDFTGDYSSEVIKVISGNEWIIYYYTRNPWPIPDSDCVAIMSFSENTERGTADFKLSAAPDLLEGRKVNRMSFFDFAYSFRNLGNGTVGIVVTGRTSPPVKVPLWLINSAFPGAPADGIRKFVKLAKTL